MEGFYKLIHPQMTLNTVGILTLKLLCENFGLNWEEIINLGNKLFIHPEWSKLLSSINSHQDPSLNLVLGSMYVEREEVIAMVEKLEKSPELDRIFAVDGYAKENGYVGYIDNLRYGSQEKELDAWGSHVKGVRKLYDLNLTPEEIHSILLDFHEYGKKGENADIYGSCLGSHEKSITTQLKNLILTYTPIY